MSRFYIYRVDNKVLIYTQKPGATLVTGFNKWRDQSWRNVMKGEKGIIINNIRAMRQYLEEDETEFSDISDAFLEKLEAMSDYDFDAPELFPDF